MRETTHPTPPPQPVPADLLASSMTLRDYFAGQAMARIVAADKDGVMGPHVTAGAAYRLADSMRAARAGVLTWGPAD